ncbi:MAG: PilZ domain-containing protein [Acidimicrobiales bacterium]|nr:PilZ domain-containing protein [Acidimicrobiales bacterium]
MEPRRRRAPRVATPGWAGRCLDEDADEPDWYGCEVIDLSIVGVGLYLYPVLPLTPAALLDHHVVVHVQPPVGDSISVRLRGRVANASVLRDGAVRVGLEFVDLSETERQILRVLELLDVVW